LKIFVYSCNIMKELIDQRGIKYQSAEGAVLDGYQLVFTKPSMRQANKGYPGLLKKEGTRVEGVLYEMDESEVAKLDKYEGVLDDPPRSKKMRVTVEVVGDGRKVEAEMHFALQSKEGLRPSDLYIRRLLSGVETYGLSKEYAEYLKTFETVKNEPRR
jgi:gamma-glutamylcyclotransferase